LKLAITYKMPLMYLLVIVHINNQSALYKVNRIVTFIGGFIDIAKLTPKGRRPFFGPFLDFGQVIVDAIFVQKISNFW
jgi:hypothetical protein